MLKERIEKARSRLEDQFGRRMRPIDPPADFNAQLSRLCQELVNRTVREAQGKADAKQIINSLSAPDVRQRLGITEMEGNYGRLHGDRETLLHSMRVEDRADLREKFRFLAFRMLLALGIAAVVLMTGYVAKVAEIPLPMLRIP